MKQDQSRHQKRMRSGFAAAVVTACAGAVLVGPLAPTASARPANSVEGTYYSDASMTKVVGTSYLSCAGGFTKKGRITAYADFIESPCN